MAEEGIPPVVESGRSMVMAGEKELVGDTELTEEARQDVHGM